MRLCLRGVRAMRKTASWWSPRTFSKNRERWLASDLAWAFFDAVVMQGREAGLLSDEHFTVDSIQLEAWASATRIPRTRRRPIRMPSCFAKAAPAPY
jgi:hypothetical protein